MKEILTDNKFEIIYEPENVLFSEQQLKIIPIDPEFEPTKEQQLYSIKLLIEEFPDSEIRSSYAEQVEFIDPGANFNSVSCNLCGRNIDIELWQQLMDKAYLTDFKDLSIITPCCKKKSTLNDLEYDFPAGFSKYQLTVFNTTNKISETSSFILDLKKELGIDIKLVWAKY